MAITNSSAELAVVIVSYNVRELLRRCLESIDAAATVCRVVVVDNASHDDSAAMVSREFPAVELIASDDNLGFSGGNNVALRALLRSQVEGPGSKVNTSETFDPGPSLVDPPYILLLNPDTEVIGQALELMLDYMRRYPEVAVVGPRLHYADGTLQSSRRRFPTPGTLFWESTLFEQWWPRNRWALRYRYADRPVQHVAPVGWLVGAALMVRSDVIRRAGLFDERFWMYSEELEWQGRLSRYGSIAYLPDALIMHYEGRSSEQNMVRRHIAFNRSKLRYAGLKWGRRVEMPLRLFLLWGYIVQIVMEAAKWLLGHKRPLRRQRIAEHARVFRALARSDKVTR